MRTISARDIRSFAASNPAAELPSADAAELAAQLRPIIERVRRGQWCLSLTGPSNAREYDEAALFQARLLELVDRLG